MLTFKNKTGLDKFHGLHGSFVKVYSYSIQIKLFIIQFLNAYHFKKNQVYYLFKKRLYRVI